MIEFLNVSYTYPGSDRPAIQSVSASIPDGSFVLICGPSGSGKSTLLRCVNGLIPYFSGGILQGKLQVNDLDPVEATPQKMSRVAGFVFQDPEAQFVVDRVEDEIAFALENMALPRDEMITRVGEVLGLLGIEPLRQRYVDTLSGGERQKVAIAAALALRPGILLLDEPTSQLDPQAAEDLLEALLRLNRQAGLTILLSEHRLERVLPYIHQVIYLQSGTAGVIAGTPQEVFSRVEVSSPILRLGRELGWRPLPLTVEEARIPAGKLHLKQPGIVDPARNPVREHPLVEVADLDVAIEGKSVLKGINFKLFPGELVVMMGPNGAGKTTLLRCLTGLLRPQSGGIKINGQDIAHKDVADICRQVAYLPQDPNVLLFADQVQDELIITLRNHLSGADRKSERAKITAEELRQVEELLTRLGIAEFAQAYPRDLSVGQRQRAALGAVMVTRPPVLLLDEPTRGLDGEAKEALGDLLSGWQADGMAILMVTHDVELAASCASRVVILRDGQIRAADRAEVILADAPFAAQMAQLFPGMECLTVQAVLDRIVA